MLEPVAVSAQPSAVSGPSPRSVAVASWLRGVFGQVGLGLAVEERDQEREHAQAGEEERDEQEEQAMDVLRHGEGEDTSQAPRE